MINEFGEKLRMISPDIRNVFALTLTQIFALKHCVTFQFVSQLFVFDIRPQKELRR